MDELIKSDSDSQVPAPGVAARLSGFVAGALKYWEPRRLVCNGVLASVVLVHFLLAWPGSWDKLSLDLALGIFFLAVLANVTYCCAYIPDVVVQFSGLHEQWQVGRTVLLIVGTAFGATITHFFAKGLFGS